MDERRRIAARVLDVASTQLWAMESSRLAVVFDILTRQNEDVAALEARLGRRLDNTRSVTNREGIAIIPVAGPIVRYAGLFEEISGATSAQTVAVDFNAALSDPDVQGIIFTFDSPGGQVNGTSELADMIYAARGRKPMAAYIEYAASAAYWIASAAPVLYINDVAQAGNIGVVFRAENPDARSGPPRFVEITSDESPLKRVDVGSESGQQLLRRYANETFEVFATRVAKFRGVTRERVVSDFGRGANRMGADAVKYAMADRVGSLEGLIADMKASLTAPRSEFLGGGKAEGDYMPNDDKKGNRNLLAQLLKAAGFDALGDSIASRPQETVELIAGAQVSPSVYHFGGANGAPVCGASGSDVIAVALIDHTTCAACVRAHFKAADEKRAAEAAQATDRAVAAEVTAFLQSHGARWGLALREAFAPLYHGALSGVLSDRRAKADAAATATDAEKFETVTAALPAAAAAILVSQLDRLARAIPPSGGAETRLPIDRVRADALAEAAAGTSGADAQTRAHFKALEQLAKDGVRQTDPLWQSKYQSALGTARKELGLDGASV